jgi:anti-anti-sigma factor
VGPLSRALARLYGVAVAEPFSIEVTRRGGDVHVVSLRGELDFNEAPLVAPALDELRGAAPVGIVLDLSELTFIDSSGINALVVAARAVAAEGNALVVAEPTPGVQRVFAIVKLSELVRIESTLDAAMRLASVDRGQTAG